MSANAQAHDCIQVRMFCGPCQGRTTSRLRFIYSPWDGRQRWWPRLTKSPVRNKMNTRSSPTPVLPPYVPDLHPSPISFHTQAPMFTIPPRHRLPPKASSPKKSSRSNSAAQSSPSTTPSVPPSPPNPSPPSNPSSQTGAKRPPRPETRVASATAPRCAS